MPSPYPGMDPYLESHWGDIHQRLVIYASDALQTQLPASLRARVAERVFVHYDDFPRRSVVPDVRIRERPGARTDVPQSEVSVADAPPVAESIIVSLANEPITEGFIEITETGGGRVVTIVEVISLANKLAGEGKRMYRKKQREMQRAGVNIVEIDLLRQGPWIVVAPRDAVPQSHRKPYRVCVWRCQQPDECEMFQATFRERLPVIPIPLRPADPEARLDLQALIDRCYANGAYDDIDYSGEPTPPLSRNDVTWSHQLLSSHGLRG